MDSGFLTFVLGGNKTWLGCGYLVLGLCCLGAVLMEPWVFRSCGGWYNIVL